MKKPLYNYIAGTGGIGTGRFFELEGNHTLGRSESRLGRFTEYRDYCKLHIILHYASVLLRGIIPVYAIGRTGADEEGRALRAEMKKAGINTVHVTEDASSATMYSICCQYPNGEGFNITANNSACQTVGIEDIDCFFNGLEVPGPGIVIAAPEVPLEARLHLLKTGREKHCFTMAAVPSAEAEAFTKLGGAALTDLISLNREEALEFASLGREKINTMEEIFDGCESCLKSLNPEIAVIITLGGEGAFARRRDRSYACKAVDVPVVNTAGAGDCFLGTVAAARVWGIDLFPTTEGGDKRDCAMDLGITASGKKVMSENTIDFSMNPENLNAFAREHGILFSSEILDTFFGGQEDISCVKEANGR